MSHYIVRVYRKESQKDRADRLYGVVEKVQNGSKLIFRNFSELWSILSSSDSIQYAFEGLETRENQKEKHPKEKRREARFPCQSPMIYCVHEGVGKFDRCGDATGKLIDISSNGMRLETREAIREREVFKVSIPMTNPPVTFPTLAQVKWVRRNHSRPCLAGLQFVASAEKLVGRLKS